MAFLAMDVDLLDLLDFFGDSVLSMPFLFLFLLLLKIFLENVSFRAEARV